MVNGRGQSEGKEEAKMTTSAMPMLIMAAVVAKMTIVPVARVARACRGGTGDRQGDAQHNDLDQAGHRRPPAHAPAALAAWRSISFLT
jgi:hypothetical protein